MLRDLPEKLVTVHYVELDDEQRSRYNDVLNRVRADVSSRLGGDTRKLGMHILEQIQRLKELAIYDDESGQKPQKMEWIEEMLR